MGDFQEQKTMDEKQQQPEPAGPVWEASQASQEKPGQQDAIERMRAVTFSREYGSGGGVVAQRLAQRLGWELVDHQIVVEVARELNISVEEVAAQDERVESIVSNILTSMQMIAPTMMTMVPYQTFADAKMYHEALTRVVEAAAKTGHVVIVGRGSQMLLAKQRDVLHVRIVAPMERRIEYVMQREGLNQRAARTRIQVKDQDRERYLLTEYQAKPNDAHLYDVVVNSGVLDLDSVVDVVYQTLKYKAQRLDVPDTELGPVVGLGPYPGNPEDLRNPE